MALQVVSLEQFSLGGAIAVVGHRLVDFEMIAPAGQFETLVAEFTCLAAHIFDREVGPLTGEERDRSRHGGFPRRSGSGIGWY